MQIARMREATQELFVDVQIVDNFSFNSSMILESSRQGSLLIRAFSQEEAAFSARGANSGANLRSFLL
jgi:hypothetical protein